LIQVLLKPVNYMLAVFFHSLSAAYLFVVF